MQDSNLGSLRHQIASRLNAHTQTDWAIERIKQKLELNIPSLWWLSFQPTWRHCQNWFTPGSGDIHNICCLILMVLRHREVISNRKEAICLPLQNAGFELWKSETPNRQHTECPLTNRLGYRGNSTARPYDECAFSPLDFRKCLSTLLALCAGNSRSPENSPPVTRSFDVFFDMRLNKRLSEQSKRWWFDTPSRSLWRHCN